MHRLGAYPVKFEDNEKLSLTKWGDVLGIAPATVKEAALRVGISITEGEAPYPNMLKPKLIGVSDFPELIRGLQEVEARADGKEFHPWTKDVDINVGDFSVNRGDRKQTTLVYKAPKE